MEPSKEQSNIGAGLAAIGVVLATAIGVFASTFNPPPQSVASDTTSAPATPTAVTIPDASSSLSTPAPSPAAFGSIFPAPDTATTTPASQTGTAVTQRATSPTPMPAPAPVVAASVYRDGTYSATGSYNSPGGEDQVAVTLTVANDIVTSVSAIPKTQDRTSARYQAMFVSGYKQYVVGKDLSSVHVGIVSGSSLTGIGFNAAIAKIEAEAKA